MIRLLGAATPETGKEKYGKRLPHREGIFV